MEKPKELSKLDRLAMEDFGSTDVSTQQRIEARKLAKKEGITPREALSILRGEANSISVDKQHRIPLNQVEPYRSKQDKTSDLIDPRSYVKSESGKCAYCGSILPKSQMKTHIQDEHRPKKPKFFGGRVRIPGLLGEKDFAVLDERTQEEDWHKDE